MLKSVCRKREDRFDAQRYNRRLAEVEGERERGGRQR